jgi:hypothetical protein
MRVAHQVEDRHQGVEEGLPVQWDGDAVAHLVEGAVQAGLRGVAIGIGMGTVKDIPQHLQIGMQLFRVERSARVGSLCKRGDRQYSSDQQ